VKNQYFGDTRDLFKYDLALHIIEGIPSIRALTFVPMLTPDDGSRQGSRTDHRKAAAGCLNTALVRCLAGCVRDGKRDIREIRPFFGERGIPVHLHGMGFSPWERPAYFSALPDSWLSDALVLVDPDIGMEVARPTGKHLLFSELGDLFGRLGGDSVLMIFQYIPRVNRDEYLGRRIRELGRIIPQRSCAISDPWVGFFFVGREERIMEQVRELLIRYRDGYPALNLSL
jgi:hypothetical protein